MMKLLCPQSTSVSAAASIQAWRKNEYILPTEAISGDKAVVLYQNYQASQVLSPLPGHVDKQLSHPGYGPSIIGLIENN